MFALYKLFLNIIFSYYIVTLLVMFFLGIGQKFVREWTIDDSAHNISVLFFMAWNNFSYESNWSGTHPNWQFLSSQGVACRWAGRVCDATIGTNSSIQRNSEKNVSRNTSAPEKRTIEMQTCANFQPTRTRSNTSNQQGRNECTSLSSMIRGNWTMKGGKLSWPLSVIAPKRRGHSEKVNIATPKWAAFRHATLDWLDLSWLDTSVPNLDGD